MAVASWYTWWERRKFTRGEALQAPVRSAQAISVLALNFARVKKLRTAKVIRHGWTKPLEGFVELNVDAAFNEETGTWRTGAIIRDYTGAPIAGGSSCMSFIDTPATA